MSNVKKRSFSLSSEQAAFIDGQVATGQYASGSEVIRAGLRALQERDEAVENGLREKVARSYDAIRADPTRAINIDDAFAALRRRHTEREKSGG